MAYISTEQVAFKRQTLKEAFPGWKFSVRKDRHSAIRVTILSGPIDFFADEARTPRNRTSSSIIAHIDGPSAKLHDSVNQYYIKDHWAGEARDALLAINEIVNDGNYDNSDIQSDYFDVGFYVTIEIGSWEKSYVCTTKPQEKAA